MQHSRAYYLMVLDELSQDLDAEQPPLKFSATAVDKAVSTLRDAVATMAGAEPGDCQHLETAVKKWMEANKHRYVDATGECNCTLMAVAAADHFGVPDDDDDTLEDFSFWAVDVAG